MNVTILGLLDKNGRWETIKSFSVKDNIKKKKFLFWKWSKNTGPNRGSLDAARKEAACESRKILLKGDNGYQSIFIVEEYDEIFLGDEIVLKYCVWEDGKWVDSYLF